MAKKSKVEMETQILETALLCVEKDGVASTNSYNVMRRLKMSQPTFFYYFKNQKGFFQALVAFIIKRNHDHVSELAKDRKASTNWEKLLVYLHVNLAWARLYPAEADVMYSGFLRCAQDPVIADTLNKAMQAGEDRVVSLMASGIMDGDFAPKTSGRELAIAIHKMIFGAMIQIHCERMDEAQTKSVEARLTDVIRSLVLPRE